VPQEPVFSPPSPSWKPMPKLVDSDRAVVQAAKKANKQKEKANRREKRVPHLGGLLCFVCLWLCWRLYVCAGLSVSVLAWLWLRCYLAALLVCRPLPHCFAGCVCEMATICRYIILFSSLKGSPHILISAHALIVKNWLLGI
jgi:hypothetical protein